MKFEIQEDARNFLDNQIKIIKRGWRIYLPLSIVFCLLTFLRLYKPEKTIRVLIEVVFVYVPVSFFTFVVHPLRRMKLLNHLIEDIYFDERGIKFRTCAVLWKEALEEELAYTQLRLKKGASDKVAEFYGYSGSFRLYDDLNGKEYLISTAMFPEHDQIHQLLTEKIS